MLTNIVVIQSEGVTIDDEKMWVKSYEIQISNDTKIWRTYAEGDVTQVILVAVFTSEKKNAKITTTNFHSCDHQLYRFTKVKDLLFTWRSGQVYLYDRRSVYH